ncbi:hypothetical protein BH11ACT4_BH11ACT4_20220 [soil metagenome]
MPEDWIEHRRGDREVLGWMRPEGHGFVVIDLLGRELGGPLDWFAAEELLDSLGIGYLAEPFELLHEGEWVRVRLTEVSVDGIRVKNEDWGDMNADFVEHRLPFPMPGELRPLARR